MSEGLSHDSSSKKHDVPIEHLDFKYVEQCNDVKELEKIYKILISGVEGKYPDLEHTVETKIRRLAPNSRILRKDAPIVTKHAIPKSEQAKLDEEIDEFVKSIPNLAKEISKNKLSIDQTNDDDVEENGELPPVRNAKTPIIIKDSKNSKSTATNAKPSSKKEAAKPKAVKPKDYREWEKIEKQLDNEIDNEKENEPAEEAQSPLTASLGETSVNSAKNKLFKTVPTNVKVKEDENLKAIKAEQEKCKGNEAFNAKSYDEAVVYYTRSIQLLENAAAYNNRALAYLKLEKWDKVIEDCNSVFKYEKDNVKALLRRSTAYFNKKRLHDAKNDIEIVVAKEPNNKKAQELSDDIKKALKKESDEKEEVKAKGGKRLTIEETDGEDESEDESKDVKKEEEVTTKKTIQIQEVEQDDDEEEEKEETTTEQKTVIESEKTEKVEKPVVQAEEPKTEKPVELAEEKTEPIVEPVKPVEVEEVKIEEKQTAEPIIETKVAEVPQVEVKIEEKPLPQRVIDLKDKANKEYSNGQYGEAISYYTRAIDQLKKDFKIDELKLYYSNTMSILYSNRASCKQKIGDFKDAINDCNQSLDIRANSVKVLFKKAHLLELLEKYDDSVVEYQKIMRLDSTYKQAQDGYNRVKNLLISRGTFKTQQTPKLETKQEEKSKVSEPAKKVEEKPTFEQLKDKGNEYFKQNNYTEALKYYTKCIEMDKANPVAYLNRSICSIKLNNGADALNDCNFVLKHEPKNVKALYRRALANKLLGNLTEAINDLKEVIRIEPKNAIAIKDLAEIERLLFEKQKKQEPKAASETKQKIEQINDEPKTEKPKVEETAEVKPKPAKAPEPKVQPIKKKPVKLSNNITNNYEFLQAWNSISPDDLTTYCRLIEKLEAQKLPKYVGNKLDDNMLSTFVKTFHKYIFDDHTANDEYVQTEDADGYNLIDKKQKLDKLDIYDYLSQLTKTQRFEIIKSFLSDDNKLLLNKCFNYFSEQIKANNNSSFNNDDVLKLKKSYGI